MVMMKQDVNESPAHVHESHDSRKGEDVCSDRSAELHGIARRTLDAAPLASDLAYEVMDRVHGKTVVSDAPAFDHDWAERLTETIGMKLKIFADLDAAVGSIYAGNHEAIKKVFAYLETTPSSHRAGPDAARLGFDADNKCA